MNSVAPAWQGSIFNTSAFVGKVYLTKNEADRLYLSLTAGKNLSLIDITTLGIAEAGKALVLDSNKDITGIRDLSITGTLSIAGSPIDLSLISGVTPGVAQANKALSLDSSLDVSSIRNLTISSTGHLIINNTEIANSLGSSGSIRTQGGAYFGQNCYFNSTSQFNGVLKVLDSTDSSALSTGSVQISGGCSISKNLYVKSIVCDHPLGGDVITLNTTSSSARCAVKFITDSTNWLLSARASGVSDPDTFYIQNSTNYRFMMQTNGDARFFSSTDSNSSFTAGALRIDGGLSVAKNINCFKNIITSNGNQLVLQTGATPSDFNALLEVPGTGTLHMATTYSSQTTHLTLGKGLWVGSTVGPSRGYTIDLSNNTQDVKIALYATGFEDSSVYGIGCKNSNLQFISPQNFAWIDNESSFPGTMRMFLDSAGKLAIGNSSSPACGVEISNGSFRIKSKSSPGSGKGLELDFDPGSDTANIYSFDRTGGGYMILNINDAITINSDRYIGIRKSAPICVLDVGSSVTSSTLNSFGYLSSSGSGTASGFSNRPFSIRTSSGIRVDSGEIDVISDIRLKKNIVELDDHTVNKVLELEAIKFQYQLQAENDTQFHLGFRAQDLVRKGLSNLCGYSDSDDPLPDEDIECEDGSIVHLRGSQRLVLNLPEMIPCLQRAIQIQQKIIAKQKEQIDFLIKENEMNDKRVDDLIDAIHDIYEELDSGKKKS